MDDNHLVFLKTFYKICILTIKFGCSFCDITLKNLTLDIGRQKKKLSENFRENAVLMQQQEGPTF